MANVVLCDGMLGAGKTLFASTIANYIAQKSNATLYSNFGMYNAKDFRSHLDFLDVADQPSSIVVLDECWNLLDSRSFSLNSVKYFTNLCNYLRKLRCTLILTTPQMDAIDKRVRQLTNIYCFAEKDKRNFYYWMYNWQNQQLMKRLTVKQSKILEIAPSLYDTYAMVYPIHLPDKQNEFDQFQEILKVKSDQYYERLKIAQQSRPSRGGEAEQSGELNIEKVGA